MLGEYIKELNLRRYPVPVLFVPEGREPVYEAADDALHVDVLVELSARLQERPQRLKVELVGEHLQQGRRGIDHLQDT